MAVFVSLVGLIATLQGMAWLGASKRWAPRRRAGALLAPIGLLLFALGVTWFFVPEFFADRAGFDGR